jgi:hypothetical protein
MAWGDEQAFIAATADNEVEIVQYISSKNTQVCGCRISEPGKFAPNSHRATIVSGKFKDGCDQYEIARSANAG